MVLSQCNKCGRSENLSYVGGQWWCRNCLFEETFDLNIEKRMLSIALDLLHQSKTEQYSTYSEKDIDLAIRIIKAIFYVLLNQDTFADRYPYGYSKLWDMFRDGDLRSYYITNSEIDEFISDHLEDYAEWIMTNNELRSCEDGGCEVDKVIN